MVPVKNYDNLIEWIGNSFSSENGMNYSKVAGLLFAQPNEFTKKEILSGIDYFNKRSGKYINFYCIGYEPMPSAAQLPTVTEVNGIKWAFNSEIFENFRKELQKRTKWTYSGSVELLLFNSYFDKTTKKVILDFSDAICIDLIEAKKNELFNSVGNLFENIFLIADNIDAVNPIKKMSQKLLIKTGKKSIVNFLINLLPRSIQKEAKKIYLLGTVKY